ncbi:DNA-binding transcriptional regulator [Pseudomonas sp. TTU2014-080ASC]|uniref:DNA-binding transcriptional regulator n=1 Tax=Pseudomonas sp. TTU2014-080ASC TaxID=1729724 RepID=UPI00071854B1|nr:DNA-binding transcriptional regulator [Pseudomonas sp. TTU2014-080ASC]KRW61436.1 transcriptional regulator [Pseudomonas sp. TTU2014-080ASC]
MTQEEKETEYKSVRGLIRGLAVLHAMSRASGSASINQLSQETGLHRTTVRRLLETLQHEGYVKRHSSEDSLYQLTLKVRELSEGFRDEQWISSLASPVLGSLLQKVHWPTDLCTLDVDAMLVRETTHKFSRLSFNQAMIGRRLPMLYTSVGRAYISFCPDDEREAILDLLRAREDEEGALARDETYIRRLIEHTRKTGYGENYAHWQSEKRIAAIALPVFNGEKVAACLSLVYVAKAMTIQDAAKRYLPMLKDAVGQIEACWKQFEYGNTNNLFEEAEDLN